MERDIHNSALMHQTSKMLFFRLDNGKQIKVHASLTFTNWTFTNWPTCFSHLVPKKQKKIVILSYSRLYKRFHLYLFLQFIQTIGPIAVFVFALVRMYVSTQHIYTEQHWSGWHSAEQWRQSLSAVSDQACLYCIALHLFDFSPLCVFKCDLKVLGSEHA